MPSFISTPPSEKAALIEQFSNQDLQDMAIHILGHHFPEHLPTQYQVTFSNYMDQALSRDESQHLTDFRNQKRYTILDAEADLAEAKQLKNLDQQQTQLLEQLEKHYQQLYSTRPAE